MVQETSPPWAEVVTILRLVRGWTQAELARAVALKEDTIRAFERGVRTPPPATRRRLLLAMGFPVTLLDRTLRFVLSALPTRDLQGRKAEEFAPPQIEALLVRVGIWSEELSRQILGQAIAEARDSQRLDHPGAKSAKLGPIAANSPLVREAVPPRASPVNVSLAILRRIRGGRQQALARAVGAHRTAISRYEKGSKTPRPARLRRIVEALGFTLGMLDRTIAFVLFARAVREFHLLMNEEVLGVQIDDFAAGEAQRLETVARDSMERLETAARVFVSRVEAPALWARLASYPPSGMDALVHEAPEFQTPGLCELLCEESVRAAGDSAERAVQLAERAVLIAERLALSAGLRDRMMGYARAHLASAFRVAGDLTRSAGELARALALWTAGASEDPGLLNAARVLHIEASLRSAQGHPTDAVELLDQALAIDRWGETPSLLIGKAKAVEDLGHFADAITLLREAEPLVDGEREPRQLWVVRLNLAVNLCHLGRHAEAQLRFPEVQALVLQLGNRLDLLRVEWLRGRLAAGLGHPEEAVAAFAHVRDELTELGIAYDAALVTVELAEAYATLGHTREVKALAQASAPTFHAQGVHREAQRVLDLFLRAAEEERASALPLRAIVVYLYRARHNPDLRFEAA